MLNPTEHAHFLVAHYYAVCFHEFWEFGGLPRLYSRLLSGQLRLGGYQEELGRAAVACYLCLTEPACTSHNAAQPDYGEAKLSIMQLISIWSC